MTQSKAMNAISNAVIWLEEEPGRFQESKDAVRILKSAYYLVGTKQTLSVTFAKNNMFIRVIQQ